jgi:hypothetical protein
VVGSSLSGLGLDSGTRPSGGFRSLRPEVWRSMRFVLGSKSVSSQSHRQAIKSSHDLIKSISSIKTFFCSRHFFTHSTTTTFFLRTASLSRSTVARLAKWVQMASKVQVPSFWCASRVPALPEVAKLCPLDFPGEATMTRVQRGSQGLPQ